MTPTPDLKTRGEVMEFTVKDIVEIKKEEENGEETVTYKTTMKDDTDNVTVSVKNSKREFNPGDRVEVKIIEKQSTLVPIKG